MGVTSCGIFLILLSCVANVKGALQTVSPAFREVTLHDGGCVNIFTLSEAACYR